MKYIYATKYVNSVSEYLSAIDEGYVIIDCSNELRIEVLNTLRSLKDKNNDYLYAYSRLLYKAVPNVEEPLEKFEICKILAKRGHSEGIAGLGYCFFVGIGTTKSFQDAITLFAQAKEKGSATATYLLGLCQTKGYASPIDVKAGYKTIWNPL